MAPGVPGGLIEPSTFGTIAGAGIPPSAALSPGMPSSGGFSNRPPAQAGCRHPNHSHAGSSWATVVVVGTVRPVTAIPVISAAAAVLASVARAPEVITARLSPSQRPWGLNRIFAAGVKIVSAQRGFDDGVEHRLQQLGELIGVGLVERASFDHSSHQQHPADHR
jgi:hypothetical protein